MNKLHLPLTVFICVTAGLLASCGGGTGHSRSEATRQSPRTPPPPRTCDVTAASAAAVRSAVQANAGKTVCYRGALAGNLDLTSARPDAVTTIAPAPGGGSFSGGVILAGAANITFEGRAAWTTMYSGTANVTLQNCTLGGTPTHRLSGADIVHIQADAHDITVQDCSIGWSAVNATSDSGFGFRILQNGAVSNITIRRNRIHNTAEDAIQVGGAPANLTIDRNEISYVATQNPHIDPHADLIQLVGYGPNTRITNNYMHHLGYPVEGSNPPPGYPSGGLYIHGGNPGPLLFENNLIEHGRNTVGFGDLGTGGCIFRRTVVRRNTVLDMGDNFGGHFPDLNWAVCGGPANLLERNAIDELGIPHRSRAGTVRDNVTGSGVAVDASGRCTTAACNPRGREPIGYRKPTGVSW